MKEEVFLLSNKLMQLVANLLRVRSSRRPCVTNTHAFDDVKFDVIS